MIVWCHCDTTLGEEKLRLDWKQSKIRSGLTELRKTKALTKWTWMEFGSPHSVKKEESEREEEAVPIGFYDLRMEKPDRTDREEVCSGSSGRSCEICFFSTKNCVLWAGTLLNISTSRTRGSSKCKLCPSSPHEWKARGGRNQMKFLLREGSWGFCG